MTTNPFSVARKQRKKETAEDYTELIFDLQKEKGEAKICDIAKKMNISHVTALRALQRLAKEGYLKKENHQPVSLTKKGKELAVFSKNRHKLILEFLISLGVPESVAKIDAEGIEHHISEETLKVFASHLN